MNEIFRKLLKGLQDFFGSILNQKEREKQLDLVITNATNDLIDRGVSIADIQSFIDDKILTASNIDEVKHVIEVFFEKLDNNEDFEKLDESNIYVEQVKEELTYNSTNKETLDLLKKHEDDLSAKEMKGIVKESTGKNLRFIFTREHTRVRVNKLTKIRRKSKVRQHFKRRIL